MNIRKIVLLLSLTLICTFLRAQNSQSEIIWIDKYKTALIRFDSDSNIILINLDNRFVSKSEYSILENYQDNIKLELLTNGIYESEWCRKASMSDLLLGKWNGIVNNQYLEFDIVYSYRLSEWEFYINYNRSNEQKVPFNIISENNISINDVVFSISFNDKSNKLMIKNSENEFALVRGSKEYRNAEFTLDFNYWDSDSSNYYSGSKSIWTSIQSGENLGLISLSNEGIVLINGNPFIVHNRHLVTNEILISPSSRNKVFVVFYIEDSGLFLLNNFTNEIIHLDIYSPNLWLAWSPHLNFAVLHHYYEGHGTLYLYDISYNILREVDMSSLINDDTQIFYDLESLSWISNEVFSIFGTMNCNPYGSSDCDDHELVLANYYFEISLKENSVKSVKLED